MGQPITVTVRAGSSPHVRFFECNRSLTSMAIESYTPESEALTGERPPDVLAHRLIEAGATRVTIYSNVVTVEAPVDVWAELEPKAVHLMEHLFEFYGDDAGWSFEARGVEPEISKVQ
ncbi:MAG TPA: hypothetical protein VGP92_09460 [Acidimicrobiia bacterium]|jgi:hypothetical protein|nr:hypothetical protein [Acidimicrobiia bacterium]